MPKYIIERVVPDAGELSPADRLLHHFFESTGGP